MAVTDPVDHGALSVLGGAVGVLVLHGYTGSPASVRPLAEAFVKSGYSVEVPLLPGHGSSLDDLLWTSFDEWFAVTEQALDELFARTESVVVCGHSMGGTLACTLALSSKSLSGLVLINPFIEPPAPDFVSMMYAALEAGVEVIPSIGSDVSKEGVSSSGYGATPIRPLLSLFEAADGLLPRLSEITTDVLLFSSRVDHVVPPRSGDLLEEHLGGPLQRVMLENSFHLATHDYDAPMIEARSIEFVEKVTVRR